MSDDERDFIQLCDSILDDGEVSAEEAYGIAEWLNDHPEIARSWPANGLVKPLQEIWADGSVNRRELHRLARLLVSVQREWAQRPEQDVDRRLPGLTPSVVAGDPRLPSLNAKFRIPSSSELGVVYDVELAGPSCSCPDWQTRRSRLPTGHLTRCCKHVLDAYAHLSYEREVEEWLHSFIDTGWPARPGTQWKLLTVDGDKVLVSSAANKGWANVFAREDETYIRFGYNIDEERWAYGSEPEGSSVIVAAIKSFKEAPRNPGSNATRYEKRSGNKALNRRPFSFNRWRIAVFLLLAILLFVLWKNRESDQPRVASNVSSQEPSSFPVSLTPSSSVARPTMPLPAPAKPWTVRTTREVRVRGPRTIVIPAGTQLRVIARAGKDLFVSYNGAQITIPASTTDVR